MAKHHRMFYMQEIEFVQYCEIFHVGLLDFALRTERKLTYFPSKDEGEETHQRLVGDNDKNQ